MGMQPALVSITSNHKNSDMERVQTGARNKAKSKTRIHTGCTTCTKVDTKSQLRFQKEKKEMTIEIVGEEPIRLTRSECDKYHQEWQRAMRCSMVPAAFEVWLRRKLDREERELEKII